MRISVCGAAVGWVALLGAGFCAQLATAQQNNAAAGPKATTATAYDVRRETTLQGTVVSFVAASTTPPLAAHVVLQTASGTVDVDLGDARTLAAKQLSLNAGDSVKILGEKLSFGQGTPFVARIVQKGEQSVAVRSVRGFPLKPLNKTAGGAL